MIALRLVAVFALVGVNAFFAAAEFSLVAIRLSRLRQLVEQGDPRARVIQELIDDLDRVVSGVQVGITLTSLGLGFLGQITLVGIIQQALWWVPGPKAAVIAHSFSIALEKLCGITAAVGPSTHHRDRKSTRLNSRHRCS